MDLHEIYMTMHNLNEDEVDHKVWNALTQMQRYIDSDKYKAENLPISDVVGRSEQLESFYCNQVVAGDVQCSTQCDDCWRWQRK